METTTTTTCERIVKESNSSDRREVERLLLDALQSGRVTITDWSTYIVPL